VTGVGTLREGPLHRDLKSWYRHPGDDVEVPVGAYVVDIVRGDTLIEVQTSGFTNLGDKLGHLLDAHRVVVVHPIVLTRQIIRVDGDGVVVSSRRSPKRGRAADVFTELVSWPTLLDHPNLSIDLVLVDIDELRRFHPGRAWRRHGWVVAERRLRDVHATELLDAPSSLRRLLPDDLPETFTSADLAARWGGDRRLAQRALYCLRHLGLVRATDRTGRGVSYVWVAEA
jgi:hypothetical protein